LKEPVRSITSYSQLLLQRYSSQVDDSGKEFLGFVNDGVRRMDALLRDLLSYSQHLGGKPLVLESVNVEAVLLGVLMKLQPEIKDRQAAVTHDVLPASVTAQYAPLSQLFEIVITNALRYTRPGVTPAVHISTSQFEHAWRFSVSDNGPGIEPQYREQIFEIFKRLHGREYPGTGMGLAIAKKIVDRFGGRIWVESGPDPGSTFHFTIPN
jgi:light-regulated signal transduction histidine kinase (bacteriophytochrome)